MKLLSWFRAKDPNTQKSALLYFDGSMPPVHCALVFDVPEPAVDDEFPAPTRDFAELATDLGYSEPEFIPEPGETLERRMIRKMNWCAHELCHRHVVGIEIPAERGIERYFREHREA
jgi:hypothetical protein